MTHDTQPPVIKKDGEMVHLKVVPAIFVGSQQSWLF
jgi:hypothetical protein